MLEAPGPPFSHMARGAWRGSLRDSKNQKKLGGLFVSVGGRGRGKGETKRVDRVVLDFAAAVREEAGWEVDVARVGLYAGCGFAYAGLFVVLALCMQL